MATLPMLPPIAAFAPADKLPPPGTAGVAMGVPVDGAVVDPVAKLDEEEEGMLSYLVLPTSFLEN